MLFRSIMEMDNIETIKRVVEVGTGLSIVPEPAIAQEVKNDTLRAIQFSDETLMRPLGILLKRGRRFSPAVQEFINFLKEKSPRAIAQESLRGLTNDE